MLNGFSEIALGNVVPSFLVKVYVYDILPDTGLDEIVKALMNLSADVSVALSGV